MDRARALPDELVPYDPGDVAAFLAHGRPQLHRLRFERGIHGDWTCDALLYDPATGRRMAWQFIPVDPAADLPGYLADLPLLWRVRLRTLIREAMAQIADELEYGAAQVVPLDVPTGEPVPDLGAATQGRVTPGIVDNRLYTHSAKRYRLALDHCADRHVLDLSGGAGYGSRILARRAASVTYADVEPLAVAYAEATYPHPRVRWVKIDFVCPGAGLPFPSASFDVVTCFEVIEHVPGEQAADFLGEIVRVLKPEGMLLMSTPNKLIYQHYPDPHHVALRTAREFRNVLAPHFASVQTFGQVRARGLANVFDEFAIVPEARDEHEIFIAVCAVPRPAPPLSLGTPQAPPEGAFAPSGHPQHDAEGGKGGEAAGGPGTGAPAHLSAPATLPGPEPEPRRLRIFAFNWHVPSLCMFARTGHDFDVPNWTQRLDGRGWNHRQRPVPTNITLLEDEAEARARLGAGEYDLVVAQTLQDMQFLTAYDLPAAYLSHNRLLSEARGDPKETESVRTRVRDFLAARGGLFCAISSSKLASWKLDGRVLPVSVAVDEWGGYQGGEPAVLTVGNLMRERESLFNTALRARLVDGLPDRIIGFNPGRPGVEPTGSQAELLAAYQRHRVYLHVTMEEREDGYNMALLEAMATGMPVVSWVNATSPIVDGCNGFISADEGCLRSCLRRLLDDADLARRLGARARQTAAERFDVRHLVAACAEVFPRAIGGWQAKREQRMRYRVSSPSDTSKKGAVEIRSGEGSVSDAAVSLSTAATVWPAAVPGPEPPPRRLRVFAFLWHVPSICMLAQTGHHFDVAEWAQRLDGRGWNLHQRPVPPNVTLLSDEATTHAELRAREYDLILAQTPQDLNFLCAYDFPAVFLAHTRLLVAVGGNSEQADVLRAAVQRFLTMRGGVFCATSPGKLATWRLDGRALPLSVALDEWGGYHGGEAGILTVGNLLRERDEVFNLGLRARLVEGLPDRIIGFNPGMPGVNPAQSQAELLEAYQRFRVYLHLTTEGHDDGYNTSLAEAMATGMPVVSWAHSTSPIVDGYNGFISADEDYLRSCLRALLDDADLARRLGARARQTAAERFDVRHLVAACAEVFPRVIAGWQARRSERVPDAAGRKAPDDQAVLAAVAGATPAPALSTAAQEETTAGAPPAPAAGAGEVEVRAQLIAPVHGDGSGAHAETAPGPAAGPGPQPGPARPKVVFAAEFLYPMLGGAEHTANTVLQELAGRGYPVEAICTGEPRRYTQGAVPVWVVPGPAELRQAVVESRPDVVITQLNFAPAAVQGAKDLGVPVLLSIMSYEHVCPAPLAMLRCDRLCRYCPYWMAEADAMRLHRWALEQADLVYCCSQHMACTIKEFSGREAVVWYQPMDYGPDYVGPADPAGRRYITMCKAMLLKGALTFAEIARRMPEEQFLLVGRGDSVIRGRELPGNVSRWPDTKPSDFYAVTKVLLAPAIWPEPFGRSPLEAMANGIPVIASHVGGLPEAVGTAGILVRGYRDPDAWVRALRGLLGDQALYRSYVERGREHCRRFGREQLMLKFEDLLAQVLRRAPVPDRPSAAASAEGATPASPLRLVAAPPPSTTRGSGDEVRPADDGPQMTAPGQAGDSSPGAASGDATSQGASPQPRVGEGRTRGGGEAGPIRVFWDGDQLLPHSLALVNRELELALLATGRVELTIWPRRDDAASLADDPRFGALRERYGAQLSGPVDCYVRHCWPPDFDLPPDGRWVVIQPWEYGAIPAAWLDPVKRLVDEVWVPSNHVRRAFIASGVSPERVYVVPNGVDLARFRPDAPPRPLATERRCKFLFVGGAVLSRKGVDVLLKAYREAFSRRDDVCLVVKDLGSGWLYSGDLPGLLEPFLGDPGAPEVLCLTDTLTDEEMPGLFTSCDALVHPFRGEGYGLPVAEALACGRPVIVTQGGACDDFCPDAATYWIPAQRRVVSMEYDIAGEAWVLEPDVEALAAHMRAVYEQPDEARRRGLAGAAHARQHLGWEVAARVALARLEALRAESLGGLPPRRERATAPSFGLVMPGFTAEATAVESFRAGREHANAGRWAEAAEALHRALDLNPMLASAHYMLGYVSLQCGQPEGGLRSLRRAVELAPDSADIQSALGAALHATGEHAAAEAALQRALELGGGRADIWANLGELYEAGERWAEAAAAYERASTLAPGDDNLREALGRARARAEETSSADALPPVDGGTESKAEARHVASPAEALLPRAWAEPRPRARRLKILIASHFSPFYSVALWVRALSRAHDVRTVGPYWNQQAEEEWLQAWREAPWVPPASLTHFVAEARRRARPTDIAFQRGRCDAGEIWDRLPESWRPDLFVWVDCYSSFLPLGVEKLPCPTACLIGDTHQGLDWRIDYARQYRHVFLTFNRQHLPDFWANGIPAAWLPAACDPEIHAAPPCDKRWDIGFAGQLRPPYFAERIRLLERLGRAGCDVHVDCAVPEEVARMFAASRIVFNRTLQEDLNMRVFEALAAGSLLLTNRLPPEAGLELLFRDGEHLALYDEENLEDVARWYLEHEAERERIARAGRAEVLAKHTYAHRADQLLAGVFGAAAQELVPCSAEGVALPPNERFALAASEAARPVTSPLPPLGASDLLEAAREHLAAGAWDAAAEALNRALDLDPLSPTAHYLLGCAELQHGEPRKALAALRQAVELAPQSADVHCALGVALDGAGDRAGAEQALERALALDGDRADVWGNLGELYEREGRWAEALAAYRRASDLAPGDGSVRAALARAEMAGAAGSRSPG